MNEISTQDFLKKKEWNGNVIIAELKVAREKVSALPLVARFLENVFTFGNVSSFLSFLRGASFPPASTCPPGFHFDSFPLFLPFNPFQPSAPPANDVFSANKVFLEPTCVICMDSRVSEIKLTRLHQLLLHFFYRLGWFSYLVVICAAVSTVGMP